MTSISFVKSWRCLNQLMKSCISQPNGIIGPMTQQLGNLIEPNRVFLSEVQDDNPLDCLVQKLTIARSELKNDFDATKDVIPPCKYYCDTLCLLPYSTFVKLPT